MAGTPAVEVAGAGGGGAGSAAGETSAAGTPVGGSAGAPSGGAPVAGSGGDSGSAVAGAGGAPEGGAAGAPQGGSGIVPACTEGAKHCGDGDIGSPTPIERCEDGAWVPYTLCDLSAECTDGRCSECSTEGMKSEVLLAQCVDGVWAPCVGGDGLPPTTFEELCTEVEVTRWVDRSSEGLGIGWFPVWISALPTP